MAAAEIDWAERAGIAEQAIVRRHLRRLGGVLPGTRIGRIRWPRRVPGVALSRGTSGGRRTCWTAWSTPSCARRTRAGPDTVGMLTRGDPAAQRRLLGEPLLRRHRLARAGRAAGRRTLTRRSGPSALRRDHRPGWTRAGPRTAVAASGGGATTTSRTPRPTARRRSCWPGPASSGFAAAIADWMAEALIDPTPGWSATASGWLRTAPCARWCPLIYTYCQGVHLGTCVELAARDGHQRWVDRAVAIVDAITHRLAEPDGVLPGSGGGDGGLFAGITARYLADAAVRRPGADRGRLPVGAGQRGTRPGTGGPRSAAARCSPPTGRSRPSSPAPVSRRPTCRCSWAPGCCWRPRPGCSAPRDAGSGRAGGVARCGARAPAR